jgi:hypothetical protein
VREDRVVVMMPGRFAQNAARIARDHGGDKTSLPLGETLSLRSGNEA